MSSNTEKMLKSKTGGKYIPPGKLRELRLQRSASENSLEHQKIEWEQLKKSINGLVNKVSKSNIRDVAVDLFQLNLNRGAGVLVRSVMKAQAHSPTFTVVYAALVAIINSKLPKVGNILINRLVLQFRRAFKRNNKNLCISSSTFLAQLCNQQVAHEVLILQILYLLLNHPTDDSVDISIDMLKTVGEYLSDVCPAASTDVFEKLRDVLQEGKVGRRTQYMIEVLFQIRRDGYKEYPVMPEDLDLVEEDDKITHKIGLDDDLKAHDELNEFEFDENYEDNEAEYDVLRKEILGDDDEEEDIEEYEETEIETNETGKEDASDSEGNQIEKLQIKDFTNTNMINFKKMIYLILKGSMSDEEAAHKILKLKLPFEDYEKVAEMIVKSCAQEQTYSKYYGVLSEKLCRQGKLWEEAFRQVFIENFTTIHRYESNPLRNISKFWGHLFASDALGWEVLDVIHLNEEETTSASRICIKFIFQELTEELGIKALKERLEEEYIQPYLENIFPYRDSDHLRFSINYFTAIGLGVLTERMREDLLRVTKREVDDRERGRSRSRSLSRTPSRSYSSGYSRSRSYSRSSRSKSYSRSPARSNYSRTPSRSPESRDRSYSRSRSPARGYNRSRAPHRDDSKPTEGSREHNIGTRLPLSQKEEYERYRNRDTNISQNGYNRGYGQGGRQGAGRGRYTRDY